MQQFRWILALSGGLALSAFFFAVSATGSVVARQAPTATPAQVDLFNSVPTPEPFDELETPTRTPTPLGIAQLEARQNANVRALPDPGAELVGEIQPGTYYNVIRRYFRWIEFQYDEAPNRRGWVYDELVQIVGDESVIPVVESLEEDTDTVDEFDATATSLSITQTPGGLLTATAVARGGAGSAARTNQFNIEQVTQEVGTGDTEVLPTYTFPPGVVAMAPSPAQPTATRNPDTENRLTLPAPERIPPLVPIAALGLLGLLGLFVSSLR